MGYGTAAIAMSIWAILHCLGVILSEEYMRKKYSSNKSKAEAKLDDTQSNNITCYGDGNTCITGSNNQIKNDDDFIDKKIKVNTRFVGRFDDSEFDDEPDLEEQLEQLIAKEKYLEEDIRYLKAKLKELHIELRNTKLIKQSKIPDVKRERNSVKTQADANFIGKLPRNKRLDDIRELENE